MEASNWWRGASLLIQGGSFADMTFEQAVEYFEQLTFEGGGIPLDVLANRLKRS